MPGPKHSNAYKSSLEKELNDAHQPQKRSRHLQLTTRVQNGTPEGPKEAQRAPKRPQKVAEKMPGDLKDREGAPTGSQRIEKYPQRVPKVSKEDPKAPKWSPKRSQKGTPKGCQKGVQERTLKKGTLFLRFRCRSRTECLLSEPVLAWEREARFYLEHSGTMNSKT